MPQIRIDKILADSGLASRTEARVMISGGRVTVDGAISSLSTKADPEMSSILLDGRPVEYQSHYYFMLNKPAGVISATEDRSERTVLELFEPRLRRVGLFPVGRLDKDTTGLLLMTNDGGFAHNVISPSKHVAKKYRVTVDGVLSEREVERFASGILLADGTKCLPGTLCLLGNDVAEATIYEGKYHQLKRMFSALDKPVTSLIRISIGALELDAELPEGAYRQLTNLEIGQSLCEF